MQTFFVTFIGVVMALATSLGCLYVFNRSRCTLEEATRHSDSSQEELQFLIQERLLSYRRKYVLFGPYTLDTYEVARAHANYLALQEARAEARATLHQAAQEAAARIAEANRRYQEQMRASQEELERMRRAHAEILKNLKHRLNLVPSDVIVALQVLELPPEASFDQVRQQYRVLAKRYHPDAGGDAKRFIQIDAAYKRVIAWIQSPEA